jgi:flagellar assembly factor FliW
MFLKTRIFGEIEINENAIVSFFEGMPGFEEVKKYIILGTGDEKSPFKWLQSVDKPEVVFAVVDPFLFKKGYDINLNHDVVKKLQIENENDVLVYAIVVVPEDISKISANLKAPVIINVKNSKGMQVVLDTDSYSVRHYIIEELLAQEVAGNACSDKEEGSDHSNKR